MKVVALISGGFDSPVAAYVMAKAGAEVVLLHMDNRPFADDKTVEKVKLIAEQLRKETGQEIPLYSANHGNAQDVICHRADRMYQCVLCKRAMQLTAKAVCQKLGAGAIVMGDSLGQVASQTLNNINSESAGLDFTILRPLIGYDKLEIEAIAKKIGTFDLSALPSEGCTILPSKVITMGRPERADGYAEKCDLATLAQTAAENIQRLS